MGVFTGTLTAGAAIGLVLGGVLTSELSWRWCLYVNIAFSLVTLLGAPRLLPDLPGHKEVKIDLWSALLASVGMAALVYALGEAVSAGWGSAEIICSLITAAVLLGAFVLRQVGHSDRLLPLRVVVNHNRGWAMVGLIVNGLSTFGMMLILTYQLQAVLGYSALRTGLAPVPFALATAFGSAVLARFLMVRVPPSLARRREHCGRSRRAPGQPALAPVLPVNSARRSAPPYSTPSPWLRPPATWRHTRRPAS